MSYLQGRLFDLKIHKLVTHVRATYLLDNLILFVLRIFYALYFAVKRKKEAKCKLVKP